MTWHHGEGTELRGLRNGQLKVNEAQVMLYITVLRTTVGREKRKCFDDNNGYLVCDSLCFFIVVSTFSLVHGKYHLHDQMIEGLSLLDGTDICRGKYKFIYDYMKGKAFHYEACKVKSIGVIRMDMGMRRKAGG